MTPTSAFIFSIRSGKENKAMDLLLSREAVVSTQVLMETANVAGKRLGLAPLEVKKALDFIISLCSVQSVTKLHVEHALVIHLKYRFSIYDSLIVAAAILSGCTLLYSEDMQHKQEIEGKLTIINPFVS